MKTMASCFLGTLMFFLISNPVFASNKNQYIDIAPVTIVSTIQDSEGYTEANFDQTFLKYIESWFAKTALERGKIYFVEQGYDAADYKPIIKSDSQYVEIQGKKLGVLKLTIFPDVTNQDIAIKGVRIFGFTSKGLETVSFMRKSNHAIILWSGETGKKIKEVFGVSMNLFE